MSRTDDIRQRGGKERGRGRSVLRLVAHPQAAPMSAAHDDRRGDVLHQDIVPAAHVAPVGLQQDRLFVPGGAQPRPVIENPPVTAIGRVPDRIVALRL